MYTERGWVIERKFIKGFLALENNWIDGAFSIWHRDAIRFHRKVDAVKYMNWLLGGNAKDTYVISEHSWEVQKLDVNSQPNWIIRRQSDYLKFLCMGNGHDTCWSYASFDETHEMLQFSRKQDAEKFLSWYFPHDKYAEVVKG